MGSLSYRSYAGSLFFFNLERFSYRLLVSLFFFNHRSFSYTSRAAFIFNWGVLHISCRLHFYLGSFSYTSHSGFIFTHPVLFLCREFLLHFPCRLHFCEGNLTHPTLFSFLCGEFLLHIPSSLHFYVGSFSYTSRAGFYLGGGGVGVWGASFLCSLLSNNPLRKEVGGSWPRGKVWKYHTQTREESPRTTRTEQNITKQELGEKWAQ